MNSSKNSATNTRVVFFGNEELATGIHADHPVVLAGLIESGYTVVAVIINSVRSNKYITASESYAEAHAIPVYSPMSKTELQSTIENIPADIGVLAAYGRIVPQSVIDHFRYGILNIHPSLLPLYRGSTPIEQLLLDGADQTGVSIMLLDAGMDTGRIYAQAKLGVARNISKNNLCSSLTILGRDTLLDTLPGVLAGNLAPRPQDDSLASYTERITKQEGRLDPQKHTAEDLERQIRAYAGWPSSYFFINSKRTIVHSASASAQTTLEAGTLQYKESQLVLGCKKGHLIIDSIQPESKKAMSSSEYINSQPILARGNSVIIDPMS